MKYCTWLVYIYIVKSSNARVKVKSKSKSKSKVKYSTVRYSKVREKGKKIE